MLHSARLQQAVHRFCVLLHSYSTPFLLHVITGVPKTPADRCILCRRGSAGCDVFEEEQPLGTSIESCSGWWLVLS